MSARPAVLPTSATLTVSPTTDWHIGAGHGVPGALDALVRRAADGLPYVPGSTLTGLLRDAAATVARALDDGRVTGAWQQWHTYAFGDGPVEPTSGGAPVAASVGVGPARFVPGLRREILADRALCRATTTVRVGVAIEPGTGRARDTALRFVEYARGGLPLAAELTLPAGLEPEQATALSALLVLAVAWCDRMGGDRRRGPGEVDMSLGGASARAWAAWLADSSWTPPAVPVAPRGPAAAPVPVPADAAGWTAVDLAITTTGPLRVPAATAGNVVRGHDFLPGATLLPWLSDRWGADTVAAAVAGGAVVVRHAHPDIDGRRGLPVPLTLFRAKTGGERVSMGVPAEGHRQVRDRWTVPDPGGVLPLQVRSTAQVAHNTVDRARQRPTSPAGVHELEVIPAGRVLRSRVLVAPALVSRLTQEHGAGWARLLAGPARLGTRRRGEYGACAVAVSDPVAPAAVTPPTGGFRLWLAADAIVLDPGLRPGADPDDLRHTLAQLLGAEGLVLAAVTARTRRRDGWQGRWGLPRESQVGLAAGSVVEVTLPPDAVVDPDGWWRLVHLGVGERTVEGFGEVVVDAPLLADAAVTVTDREPAVHEVPDTADGGDHAAALRVLRGVVRRERIRAAVAEHRDDPSVTALRDALGGLSDSQRGTWRAVTAAAAVAGDPKRVDGHATGWLENRTPKRARQRAVAEHVRALLAGGRLATTLRTALDGPAEQAVALAALVADLLDSIPEETR
ncbi:MAG: hypothetical protein JNM77_00175 [Pseudonocardia sp.]|nr:hypothetical protein [Pseudonocardia sp.]